MRLVTNVLCLILVGCGIGLDLPKHDFRFNSIRDQFEKDAAFFNHPVNAKDINISFGNPRKKYKIMGIIKLYNDPGPADGVCFIVPKDSNELVKAYNRSTYGQYSGKKYIVIDNSYQNRPSAEIEMLVYHELGHCALKLPHKENQKIMKSTQTESIMGDYRYFYLKEMFTGLNEAPDFLRFKSVDITTTDLNDESNLQLVYSVDYEAFGVRIQNTLLFDSEKHEYIVDLDQE